MVHIKPLQPATHSATAASAIITPVIIVLVLWDTHTYTYIRTYTCRERETLSLSLFLCEQTHSEHISLRCIRTSSRRRIEIRRAGKYRKRYYTRECRGLSIARFVIRTRAYPPNYKGMNTLKPVCNLADFENSGKKGLLETRRFSLSRQ